MLAKAPEAGLVKTRLSPPASPVQAARLASAALLDTLDAVRATPGGQPVVALSGELATAERGEEITAALRDVPLIRQRGTSLGDRIANAHADTAELVPITPSLQIGMDTPQIDPALLQSCSAHLTGTDAVLGPATDGGWWLLGLRNPLAASAIVAVPTSRADTGELTNLALRHQGLRIKLMPQLSDVDTLEEAVHVAHAGPAGQFAAAVRELLG